MNISTLKNKTKRAALLLLLALLSTSVARAQETITVTIDEGNNYNNFEFNKVPFSIWDSYSWTRQIYLADEIGTAGYITALSFYYDHMHYVDLIETGSFETGDFQLVPTEIDDYTKPFSFEGLRVYLKHTDNNGIYGENIVPLSESDKVWEGTFAATGAGWVTINFDTPFAYDGASNLVVCCYDPTAGNNGYGPDRYIVFSSSYQPGYDKAINVSSNNGVPDLNQNSYIMWLNNRSNIQLHIMPEPLPVNLAVSNLTDMSATLTWEAPQTTYNLTGYTYQYKKAIDEEWSAEVTTTGTSATLSGLLSGTEYRFRIKGLFSDYESVYYTYISFTTLTITLPNLAVSNLTDISATLTWEAPQTPYTITGYTYQYKKTTDADWSAETTTTSTSVTLSGLASGTTYQFKARANFSDHYGTYTNISFTTITITLPNLAVSDITEHSATITWEAPQTPYTITGYAYQYKASTNSGWSAETTTSSTSATLIGLTNCTEYQFRAKVLFSDHEGDYTAIDFTTAVSLPYECGFENGMDGWHLAGILWGYTEITTNHHNGERSFRFVNFHDGEHDPQYLISPLFISTEALVVSFYHYSYGTTEANVQIGFSTTSNDPATFTWIEEITPIYHTWVYYEHTFPAGTRYVAFRFDYVDSVHTHSVALDDFYFRKYSPYPMPTNLTVSNLTDHSATLTWSAPNTNQTVSGYAYQYKLTTDAAWSTMTTVNSTSVTLNGLSPNTSYDFRVKALYPGGLASSYVPTYFFTEGEMESLPHYQDFENGMGGWRVVDGHRNTGIYYNYDYYTHCFKFDRDNNTPQYLISPMLDGSQAMLVSFRYQNYSNDTYSYPTDFQVGYSTTTKDLDAFTWDDTIRSSRLWRQYAAVFPVGTKYIAVKWVEGYLLFLDDFSIEVNCPGVIVDADHPLTENFTNSAAFPPRCWENPSVVVDGVNRQWTWNYFFYHNDAGSANSGRYGTTYLTLPELYISDSVNIAQLAFWSLYTIPPYAKCSVVLLDGNNETELWTPDAGTLQNEVWYETHIDLSAYIGQTINLAFKHEGNGTSTWSIDNVEVSVPWSGEGTEQDPFIITEAWQLEALAHLVNNGTDYNGKFFRLDADLNYNQDMQNNHKPIGNGQHRFLGTFDGDGHTISGIRINGSDSYLGIFGGCYGSMVKNLTLTNAQISGDSRVGGIVGDNYLGTVENCHVTNSTLSGSGQYIGGIVGWNDRGTLSGNNVFFATVSAGGGTILGTNQNGTLNHNYYSGCTVDEVTNATNVGTSNGDVNENYGAVFAIAVFPWMEDFLSYNNYTIPAGWDNSTSTSVSVVNDPDLLWGVYNYNGNKMLRMKNKDVLSGTALINSPMIVLQSEEEWELKFDYSHTASCGPFTVKISTDYGTTFVNLASFGKVGESTSYTDPGEFTRAFIPLTEYAGQTVMIQFYAEADYGTGAIFVDNIEIDVTPTCRNPYNIVVDDITPTTAELIWNILTDMESYSIRYRTAAAISDTVFFEGFEDDISNWTRRNCSYNSTTCSHPHSHSGNCCFRFDFVNNPPQYLISPELSGITEDMRLEFYYCNGEGGWPETFQIGYSSTDNENASFIFGDIITASDTQWHLYSEPIPAGTKYICWKHISYYQFYLYIDDVMIAEYNPAGEWQTLAVEGNDTHVSATVTGLTPETTYEAQVKSNCDNAEWSESVNFTTFGHFTVSGDEYAIYSTTGWDLFCDALQDNNTYNRFIGKTVKLGADISVTRMAGSSYHDFMGTFDGLGHTLTVAYGSAENPITEEYAAPFRFVEDSAVIHSLHVDGHIYTSNKFASGIAGCQWGTVSISNCRSSVIIHSSKQGDGTHGGIVAVHHNTLTVNGCVFNGRLLTTNGTTLCGGLIGYHYGTLTLSDCLYAPAEVTLAPGETYINNGATFCRHYDDSPDNCYYTEVMGSAQGKLAHSITGGEGITVENAGTAMAYDVSGITGYGTGIGYDDVLYAGYEDEVSLNLGTASGFNTNDIFHVSAGSLNGTSNPYTLIMPDQNVSITIPCPTPFNIATDNITATTAVLNWNILTDMENYTVRYKEFVYIEGFEKGLGDWTLRDCDGQTGVSSYSAHSGRYAFRFFYSSTPPQYLISPMLTGIGEGMRLEFYYRNQGISYPETFQIGFSSTNDATASFVFGDIITASDKQWHLYSEPIPAGTKYICWKYTSNDQWYLYIDDIAIVDDFSNNEWQTLSVNGNGTQVSTTLISLTPGASYEVQVKSNCDEALWSEIISFTTNNIDITGDTIIIYNTSGWDFFCDALQDNDTWNRFIGKTVRLAADISVTRMAGSSTHDFMGTFDGQGHTLTITYGSAENPISEEYAAPFRNVENGCVIENLHIDGTITTANKFAAGIVAQQYGAVTIRNCRSSVTIQSSVEGDGTHGGLVGIKGNSNNANLTIEGCTFDGKIVSTGTTATTLCGGFVGWRSNNGTLTITNSFYAPAADNNAVSSGATFARNWTMPDDANCYYTETLGTAQGKLAHSITLGEGVLLEMAGEATEYNISGITSYGTGIMYDSVLCAGNGDEMNLTFPVPESFSVTVTYTPEGGTATELTPVNGVFSFTMPDADVVIDAVTEYLIHNATEWENFCDALQDNGTYNRFIDRTVKLCADITVTRMAGSSYHDFMGTFDGQGHTLTLALGTAESPLSEEYAAPFRYVENGANIHSLHVDGHIYTSNKYASGIVGCQYGTVRVSNCRSSVIIHSSVNGDGTHGGIVATQRGIFTLSGCVFDGRQLTTNGTTLCGGLIGYHNSGSFTISDCLYAPATDVTLAPSETYITDGATFCRNYSGTPANCYCTETMGVAQGLPAVSDSAIKPYGEATGTYPISGLTAYVNGLMHGEVFYYDLERNFLRVINGYGTGSNGWNLIASPIVEAVTPSADNGFLANEYDLYRFNPTHEDNEWENYKAGNFNFENGKGYIYANSGNVTLVFSGTPYNGNGVFTLVYDADDERKCWNLVGNPFTSEAYLNREYYVLNADGTGIHPIPVEASTPIPAFTAVFVKAEAEGDTVVFSTTAP